MRRGPLKDISFKVILWHSFCPHNFNFKCEGEEQFFLVLQHLGFVHVRLKHFSSNIDSSSQRLDYATSQGNVVPHNSVVVNGLDILILGMILDECLHHLGEFIFVIFQSRCYFRG